MELDSEGFDSQVEVVAWKETSHNENGDDYEVEKITGMRLVKGKLWFRVRWKGYGADTATWEPRVNLTHCEELLDDYVSKVQDKKYKQKKRRQTRNALIHARKKEQKDDTKVNHVVKNKVTLTGDIMRKRTIKKFISKPNKFFNRTPQTKWPTDESLLDMASTKGPEELPLETGKERESKRERQRRRRRGRGRPKKNPTKMPDLQPQTQFGQDRETYLQPQTQPCPDREPLEIVDDIILLDDNSVSEQTPDTVVKRGRGRPPKKKTAELGEKSQSDLCRQERPTDISRKRGRPKKGVVSGGVTKTTTCDPYNGQIKLKKVVIRELRSLKALLEFQRQISDEEKENQTDTYRKKEVVPSSLEHRHVLASEYRNRFFIRIKTGKFKDLSTKRRRKRKADKEKRRKKRKARQMLEQTEVDKGKSELTGKENNCLEEEEDGEERCALPEVVEISSSSEAEKGDEDSVESQRDAPALNEEYDQFGYDDFFDFSKETSSVKDKSKTEDTVHGDLQQVSEGKKIGQGEVQIDETNARKSNNLQDVLKSRAENWAEEDVFIDKEEQKTMEEEEEAAAADDESSSLVIPFDEEEEDSSSLIIADDDDDDDDEDDLRELDIGSEEIQDPEPSALTIFTRESVDEGEQEVVNEMTGGDKGQYEEAGHCQKSSEDIDCDEFLFEEKSSSKATDIPQKLEEEKNLHSTSCNDFTREETMSEVSDGDGSLSKNHEDITNSDGEKDAVQTIEPMNVHFTEDSSEVVKNLETHMGTREENAKYEETERGEPNSWSTVPMEPDKAEKFIIAKDKEIKDSEPMKVKQTPNFEKCMEEEDRALEMMTSEIFSKTMKDEADGFERKEEGANAESMEEEDKEAKDGQIEPQAAVLSEGKEMEGEAKDHDRETESASAEGQKELTAEKGFAVEIINSDLGDERTDNTSSGSKEESCVEQMEEECEDNKKHERETNNDLNEPQVTVLSKGKDREVVSELVGPQESLEEEMLKENHAEIMNTQLLQSKEDGETHDVGRKEDRCVEKNEEECNMEAERKSKDDLVERQVIVLSKTKELDREVQADDKQIESDVAGTKENAEKEVVLDEEMEHKKDGIDVSQTDRTTTEESDKNDDQREGDKEKTNKDHEKIEAVISDEQENRDEESKTDEKVEHKEHGVPQRDIETLESGSKILNEREYEEVRNQGEACDQNIEDMEKERETEGMKSEEQVACDEKMEEVNIEEEKEQVVVPSNSKEMKGKAQAEDVEMETAITLVTLERELRLDEEVEDENNKTPQRDNDKMNPDRTPAKETENEEYDHRGEQDKDLRKTDDEAMEFEIAGTHGIAGKEMQKVEKLDSEENNMHQRDIQNLKPDLNTTKDEQDRKKEAKEVRIPEPICNVTGDKINIEEKEEMEVEEKEDGQIDSETITPEKDETRHQEGDDAVAMVDRADKEMMFTSTAENLKDKTIMTGDSQEGDKECKNSTEEAAVTVVEEKRIEYRDNQEEGVQGIPDLAVKDKGDVGCGKVECNLEKVVVVEPEEAKTTCVGKEIREETPERDRVDISKEATTTEISPAEDNLHAVEDKGRNRATGQKGFYKNLEGNLKSNCTKNNNKEDKECITDAKTEIGNELLTEKRMGEELMHCSLDNMDDEDDALLNVKKKGKAEANMGHGIEIETIDEGFTDGKENECNQNTPIPYPNEATKAENKTNGKSGHIQEDAPQEEMEVSRKTINGNSGSDQDVALQEKVEVDIDESKATDMGDRDKTMEEEGLEEGEIPEDEEDEEEKEDGVVVTIDNDKEEGEITEEIEDAAEERGRIDEDEEMTPGLTDRSKVIGQNLARECAHSQNIEQLRRRSREAGAILETSTINSDHQTTQRDVEKTRTTRSSAISMKRNFNGAYSTKEHIRSKTFKPCNAITVDDDDDDDVEVVEPDIPLKTVSKNNNDINSMESDVYIIDEEPAICAELKLCNHRTKSIEQTNDRTLKSKENPEALSPKFGSGLKKVSPTSSSRVGKVDKNGSNARRMVQSMKAHVQHTINNSRKLEKKGKLVKNSACKAQAFKPKDSASKDIRDNLFKRLEGVCSSDEDSSADKGGTKRKSDADNDEDDSDSGSGTRPKKKQVGATGKEVWQMVTRKEKKPTEPIWEGNTKINRQKIVIKISKIRLTDQPETKEPENNAKRKEPEKPPGQNSWKEGMMMEVTGGDRGCQGGMKANGVEEEPKEKQEKAQVNGRGGKAASTSTGAAGCWSTLPKAKPDNETMNDASWKNGGESRTNSQYPSDDLLKDLKELKAHGIKQSDLAWVKDLLETDHAECLSEVCAALTKFMDSKDQKINLVVEMGFCPLLVKLLKSQSPEVISSALLAVSHIVSGNDYQTQAVLECSPLPLFCCFLSRHKHDVTLRKEACLALSNITAGTSQQIQHLVNDGLFPVLLSAMQHDDFQVMYEATWAVANATVNGSPEQIRYIVKQGFFQAFSEVLKHTDDTLIQIALDAMYNVLKLDEKNKKAGKPTPYCRQVKEFGGLERIRSVRLTGSTVVKKKSYNMLTTFFPDF